MAMSAIPRSILARRDGITAMWFADQVISAWYDETGDSANLWLAHVITANSSKPSAAPECSHGLPPHLCMICGAQKQGTEFA